MGRGRKPLNMQKGNLTVEQQNEIGMAEELVTVGREQLETPPTSLVDSVSKKEYRRVVAELNKVDIVGNLDLNNLVGYANAYAYYLKSTKELKKQPLTVERYTKSGDMYMAENPLINIQKKYAEEMRKFAALCGLTIDSRLKAATVQLNKESDDIDSEFGDF